MLFYSLNISGLSLPSGQRQFGYNEANHMDTHFSIRSTDRFHVAVGLFNNRSQMTSKCGKNKKVTDVLATF